MRDSWLTGITESDGSCNLVTLSTNFDQYKNFVCPWTWNSITGIDLDFKVKDHPFLCILELRYYNHLIEFFKVNRKKLSTLLFHKGYSFHLAFFAHCNTKIVCPNNLGPNRKWLFTTNILRHQTTKQPILFSPIFSTKFSEL